MDGNNGVGLPSTRRSPRALEAMQRIIRRVAYRVLAPDRAVTSGRANGRFTAIYCLKTNRRRPYAFKNPVILTSSGALDGSHPCRVGASRPIGERTELFGGYRYFDGAEMEFSSAPFASGAAPTFNPKGARTHGLEFGLRINF